MENKSVYFLLKKDTFIQSHRFKKTAGGDNHILLLTEAGHVHATGLNYSGQSEVPDEVNTSEIIDIAAGGAHNLALARNGKLFAWGRNANGQDVYMGQIDIPDNNKSIKSITAGVYWSACSYTDGTISVWGDNTNGQCEPPEINNAAEVITAGEGNVFCLLDTGELIGWGTKNSNVPDEARYDNIFIAGGQYHHLCIKRNGDVYGWGNPDSNELTPPDRKDVKCISANGENPGWTLYHYKDGTVYGVGNNKYGQCVPREPYNLNCTGTLHKKFKHISTGLTWSVGITESGSLHGWGMIGVE